MSQRACPFASAGLGEHLARGAGAAALLVLTYVLFHRGGAWSAADAVAALAGAVALMRGCPTCWTIGLFATIGVWPRRQPAGAPEPPSAASSRPASVPAPR